MAREWSNAQFEDSFNKLIVGGVFNEEPQYYPRYKSRYKELLVRYAAMAPAQQLDILDIGGGQLALLCHALWGDRAHAADIGGAHLTYLDDQGIATSHWNLCTEASPFSNMFDFVFFSEVIEHLPVPGHVVLEKIMSTLKRGGTLICSTPNLYRLRNIIYLILGKQIFDYFRIPDSHGLGHIIEYSKDHLKWQFDNAGFSDVSIDLVQMHHSPNNMLFRAMYFLGSPLFLVPRFRDNLVAIATRSRS